MALDFLAGCVGGCTGVIVGHPFDTIKVRLQTQSSTHQMCKGTFDCFRSIIKLESVYGLYKGMGSPLYGLTAINAIVFGIQANIQRRLQDPDSLHSHFLAGCMAGFAQTVICSPMELAKTRLQLQGTGESRVHFRTHAHAYTGPVDCLVKIYHCKGISGVYRGFWLTVARETPSFGVYFAVYEGLCRQFSRDGYEIMVCLLAGGFAGMASWLSTYPCDVIKSRIQADTTGQYKGFWDCTVKSYHSEGPRFFFKGLNSTLLRAFPVNAATFLAVEMVLKYARVDGNQGDGSYDLASYAQTALKLEPHSPARHLNPAILASVVS